MDLMVSIMTIRCDIRRAGMHLTSSSYINKYDDHTMSRNRAVYGQHNEICTLNSLDNIAADKIVYIYFFYIYFFFSVLSIWNCVLLNDYLFFSSLNGLALER